MLHLQKLRRRRFLWTGTLSALLLFLLPLSWLPILLLWLWNLALSFRESAGSRNRGFYGVMLALVAALTLWSILAPLLS